MLRILIVLLLVIPTLEIWLFVKAGQGIGWIPTILFCILTGVGGAWLARQQGLRVFQMAQMQMSQGQLPGDAILDGICVFAGGLLLLTPGFLTDIFGFFLLFPGTRIIARRLLKNWLFRKIQTGQFRIFNFNRFS